MLHRVPALALLVAAVLATSGCDFGAMFGPDQVATGGDSESDATSGTDAETGSTDEDDEDPVADVPCGAFSCLAWGATLEDQKGGASAFANTHCSFASRRTLYVVPLTAGAEVQVTVDPGLALDVEVYTIAGCNDAPAGGECVDEAFTGDVETLTIVADEYPDAEYVFFAVEEDGVLGSFDITAHELTGAEDPGCP